MYGDRSIQLQTILVYTNLPMFYVERVKETKEIIYVTTHVECDTPPLSNNSKYVA